MIVECGFCHNSQIEVKEKAPEGKVYVCSDCHWDVITSQYIEPEYSEEEIDYIKSWAM